MLSELDAESMCRVMSFCESDDVLRLDCALAGRAIAVQNEATRIRMLASTLPGAIDVKSMLYVANYIAHGSKPMNCVEMAMCAGHEAFAMAIICRYHEKHDAECLLELACKYDAELCANCILRQTDVARFDAARLTAIAAAHGAVRVARILAQFALFLPKVGLQYAVESRMDDFVMFTLKFGGIEDDVIRFAPYAGDKSAHAIIDAAIAKNTTRIGETLLLACGCGNVTVAKRMVELGARGFNDGLYSACFSCSEDTAEYMLQCGATNLRQALRCVPDAASFLPFVRRHCTAAEVAEYAREHGLME